MIRAATIRAAVLAPTFLAAACVAPETAAPVRTPSAAPAPISTVGLQSVMGRNAATLVTQFGQADLDVREGTARKLQFVGPACVLDAYLYPPAGGREPVVTHVDARLPDGRDMDRASCVAALSRRQEAR